MGDLLDQTIAENELNEQLVEIWRGFNRKLERENKILMRENKRLKGDLEEEKEDVVELQKDLHQKEDIISGFIKKTFELAVTEDKYNIMREFITMCDLEDDFKTYLDSVELAFMFDD